MYVHYSDAADGRNRLIRIRRIVGRADRMSPIPVPSVSASGDPGDGVGIRLLAVGAALVAAAGLALRFIAGRRMRGDLRTPPR